ncbi:hypothetical protein JK185_14760 [Gluconobacter wancherniae]|uniref:hypothetical protein n=1 Tax=Gluconobacter wancherniae TaxID=1307955 RepID=UPI001B8CD47F|nr:hypothetical protein [Gluconobacter wancherniae]MBS1064249.1 hypothetical protein [Gluconobacter wancherniae]
MNNSIAFGAESTNSLSSILNAPGQSQSSLNQEITTVQNGVFNGNTSLSDAENSLNTGIGVAEDSPGRANNYTRTDQVPSYALSYTAGDGENFYLSNRFSVHDVVVQGQADRTANPFTLRANLAANVGQGGRFDIQRDSSTGQLYGPMIKGANYLVGVYSAATDVDEFQMFMLGLGYAVYHDGAAGFEVFAADSPDWVRGYEDYKSGKAQ